MSAATVEVNDANFANEVENSSGLVMVDFWAAWCGPCRIIEPAIDALAKEYSDQLKVGKLNVDENQNTAIKFNVRSIPAVLFFKDGKHVDSLIGAMPKASFEAKIKLHLAA